jgi:hypothetical protein
MADKQPAPLITPQMLRNWNACYTNGHIAELYDGKPDLSPLQICELQIPVLHRLWVVLREEIIPATELHELGLIFVRDAVVQRPETRQAGDKLLDVKRQWLAGQVTDAELSDRLYTFWTTTARPHDDGRFAIRYAADLNAREASYQLAQFLWYSPLVSDRSFHWLDATRKTLARLYTEPAGDRCAE